MQSPAVKTPAATKRGSLSSATAASATKSSGKKLVQARLPFKIIPPSATAAGSAGSGKEELLPKDGRKRKLSFETVEKGKGEICELESQREGSASKENLAISAKKKKLTDNEVDDIILLDDDDVDDEDDKKEDEEMEKVEEQDVGKGTKKNEQAQTTKGNYNNINASHTSKPNKGNEEKNITPKPQEVSESTATLNDQENAGKESETSKIKEGSRKEAATPKSKETTTTRTTHTPKMNDVKDNSDTPKTKGPAKKQSGTPLSNTKSKKTSTPGSAKNKTTDDKPTSSAKKIQIKLPLGSGNKVNKRRKSKMAVDAVEAEIVLSSDENETVNVKRPKIDGTPKELKSKANDVKVDNSEADKMSSTSLDDSSNTDLEDNSKVLVLEIGGNESEMVDSELGSRCSSVVADLKYTESKHNSPSKDIAEFANEKTNTDKLEKEEKLVKDKDVALQAENKPKNRDQNESNAKIDASSESKDPDAIKEDRCEKKKPSEKPEDALNKGNDIENDKSAETTVVIKSSSDSDSCSSVRGESKSTAEQNTVKVMGTPNSLKDDANKSTKKVLTPKQMKLMEQRRKAREEKERRLQEERLQKQREKEAKELERKREREEREELRRKEREEREEQKRKEREERDEQKRIEREEKERKRLAEQEAKNEEKRKRNEAKEEDLRKKEEERKRKEEADLKAKKVAEAFQKFFKTKRTSNADGDAAAQQPNQNEGYDSKVHAFRPFEVKGDMKMAPICRKQLSLERRKQLDAYVASTTNEETLPDVKELYLTELKYGKIIPGVWRRVSVDTKVSDDDVQIIDDELDRAGQAIVEETHAPIEHFRAKFYKFHENRRPPYYGTWRKRTNVIKPRRPFMQDKNFFDYDVDSDLEWEEEEPGESLDGSDDEKEKESEDDDYEVDNEWFVPHGHLSDEELQNEDEAPDANTREAQKAKLQVLQQEFAQEMKKKTEKIKPRLIGCIWTDENGNQPALCPKIIWDTLNQRAMLFEAPPLLEDPEVPEKAELGSPTWNGNEKTAEKVKPIKITERMLIDLVRLVHGNHHSKTFLIKEFIAHLEANEESIKNGEARGPLKSLVREKIEDFAEWTITESAKVLQKNKKKNKKRLCWVVSADVLEKMGLENLSLHNTWKYTLQPKLRMEENTAPEVAPEGELNGVASKEGSDKASPKRNYVEKKSEINSIQTPKIIKNKDNLKSNKKPNLKPNTEITKFAKVLPAKTNMKKSSKIVEDTPTLTNKESKLLTEAEESKCRTEVSKQPAAPTTATANATTLVKAKKRVPLLMSVARGQQISQPTKNALISEFLKKNSCEKVENTKEKAEGDAQASSAVADNSEVVEID